MPLLPNFVKANNELNLGFLALILLDLSAPSNRLFFPPQTIQSITFQVLYSFDFTGEFSQLPFLVFSFVQPLMLHRNTVQFLDFFPSSGILSLGNFVILPTDNFPNILSLPQTSPLTTGLIYLTAHSTFLSEYLLAISNFLYSMFY